MISEFGDGSAAAPMVPIWRPGYRSRSSFGRLGRDERREGRRRVVLARSRQVGNPWRDRSVRSGGGNVDPVDRLAAELVGARQPPQP